MSFLLILNDPPYGTERSYNGFRFAMALQKENPKAEINIFLIGDAVACAVAGQKTPDGYYNLERMIRAVLTKKATIKSCGSCMDARGIIEDNLVSGVGRGSMSTLANWSLESEKVIVF
ncbi:MAG: DsrE family protein [Candidatus Thorarchaeota archaeon]